MPRFLAALSFTFMLTLTLNGCGSPKTQNSKAPLPATSNNGSGSNAETEELASESEWPKLEIQFRNDPGSLSREQLLQLYRWRRESQAKLKERNKKPMKPTTFKNKDPKKLTPKFEPPQVDSRQTQTQETENGALEVPKVEATPIPIATPTPTPIPIVENDPEETIMADQRMRLHCSRFGTLQKPEQTENCLKRALPIWQNCQQRSTKADRLSCLKKALP